MTLDDVLDQLRLARCDGHISEALYQNVVSKLRAAQAMRNNLFDVTKDWQLDEALEAWDATKEESSEG